MERILCIFCAFLLTFGLINAEKEPEDSVYKPHKRMERPKDDGTWKKKDVRDYNDMDLDHLYEQWEEDDEEIPVDELPPWELEPPPIDMRKVNLRDTDSILKHGKKYRTLMMFATLAGNLNEKETEKQSALWESSLYNAGIQVKRYVIEPSKVLFQMDDGYNSVEIRDFLVRQENCWEVTLDSKTYDGKAKLNKDQFKPLTKEEAKAKKEEAAKKKSEQAKKKKTDKKTEEKSDKKPKTEL